MPNRDGTGPQGKGPRTGGARGNCAPLENEPADVRPRLHLGNGCRRGGRGRGRN